MFTILDESIKKTPEVIEEEYPNCKYILLNFGDIQDPVGNLYCVSTSIDSYRNICETADDFSRRGVPCMLSGSYNNGGAFGVQYEIEP